MHLAHNPNSLFLSLLLSLHPFFLSLLLSLLLTQKALKATTLALGVQMDVGPQRLKTNKTLCPKQEFQLISGVIGVRCKIGETDLVDLEPLAIMEHLWHAMHGVNLGLTFRDII